MNLPKNFFDSDVLDVAPKLVGKILVRKFDNGESISARITEVEAYRGEEDLACHASKGKTKRTEVMYMEAGTIYIYLVYGMYYMLNIVCAEVDNPQAILIRAVEGYDGPGKLSKFFKIDKSFNKENIFRNNYLSIIDDGYVPEIICKPRVGIDYAGDIWKNKPWRFINTIK